MMREDVFRVAYDEAHAELSEILTKFEQLRVRKDRIEKVVESLRPLISGTEPQIPEMERSAAAAERPQAVEQPVALVHSEPVQAAPSPIPYPVQQAVAEANDPFARRMEGALGLGSAARDLKEYSKLFNTTLPRGN
jgi:hypothetical protein